MDNELIKTEQEDIKNLIYTIRGKQVMLDSDVARLYDYETKEINQTVKRNIERFPGNFCFQLREKELKRLRSQFVTSNKANPIYIKDYRQYLPYVFTEQGIAMLSGLLRNNTAIQVSINIMNAFVGMRKFIMSNAPILERLTNVARIATCDKLINPFPREVEKIENIVIAEQLKDYNLIYKCDFDGDGEIEYLCFKYSDIMPIGKNEIPDNLTNLYTKKYVTTVDLFDENYNLISHLATFNDYRWDDNISDPVYLKNIDVIDIDNDGTMEIFIDLYMYEESGNVTIYKYMNNQIYGETNYTASTLP